MTETKIVAKAINKKEEKKDDKPIKADVKIEVEKTTTEKTSEENVKTKKEHTMIAIEKPKVLLELIKGVSNFVDEGEFCFSEKGLNVLSMDPANVCMVNMRIPANKFLGFERGDDSNYALNLNHLKKILSASKGGLIKMRFSDRLEMVMEEKHKELEFGLPILSELDNKTDKVLEMKFGAEINMKTIELKEALNDAGIFGESVTFEIRNNKFLISSSGNLSTMSNLSKEATVIKGEGVKSKYSIEYLKNQIIKGFDNVKIFFGNEYPVNIVYENDGLMISFITAPMVEND